jgi:transcriptional regulator with XRE-family HTH domain
MKGAFGRYIDGKRKGRALGGGDVRLKDIATAVGVSAMYLSDIIYGRRNPPVITLLEKFSDVFCLDENERAEMFDLAGFERGEVSPDLVGYIMDKALPHLRVALRRAKELNVGDDFWEWVVSEMYKERVEKC